MAAAPVRVLADASETSAGAYNRSMAWPEPVERVAAFLRAAGAEARLEELEADTPTAQAAADAVGCGLDQIVKSLVFVCDDRPGHRARPGRSAGRPGEGGPGGRRRRRARRAPVGGGRRDGFVPGGVAPFPPPAGVAILVEQTILSSPSSGSARDRSATWS